MFEIKPGDIINFPGVLTTFALKGLSKYFLLTKKLAYGVCIMAKSLFFQNSNYFRSYKALKLHLSEKKTTKAESVL